MGILSKHIFWNSFGSNADDQSPIAGGADRHGDYEADYAEGYDEGYAESYKESAQKERQRCEAIICSEFAKGREGFARYLALETELTADAAIESLRCAPLSQKEVGLLAEMKGFRQPALGIGGGADCSSMSDFQKGAMEAARLKTAGTI